MKTKGERAVLLTENPKWNNAPAPYNGQRPLTLILSVRAFAKGTARTFLP